MSCGCSGARTETITSNIAQALLDEQRQVEQAALMNEYEAMLASAAKAAGNADSNATAVR